MNCVELFLHQSYKHPNQMALSTIDGRSVTFTELRAMAAVSQARLRKSGVQSEDTVLLLGGLSPDLYANIIGCLALGATCILVEPWMQASRIEKLIREIQPKVFVAPWWGKIWGARIEAIRKIPRWLPLTTEVRNIDLQINSVDENTPGIITFTTGTTGTPKGVVRGQGYLVHQHAVLSKNLGLEEYAEPDLCVFANFALANLASGRGSVFVPKKWSKNNLTALHKLCAMHRPATLTTGPAFLLNIFDQPIASLKSIHVGGALTDCAIFERGFKSYPTAHWTHVYGSSEAEPVAVADAHEAVALSRERGLFQTLYLGKPVPEIRHQIENDSLWVAGDHVCPLYWGLADSPENREHKRRDPTGCTWHNMGDRIEADSAGWWYAGRSGQKKQDFQDEQALYTLLGTSKAFIDVAQAGTRALYVENMKRHSAKLGQFSGPVFDTKIVRDPRHRARIDRAASKKRGKLWGDG